MKPFHASLAEAIDHLTGGRFGEALSALRQALLLRPQSGVTHRAMLTGCFALGRYPDALYHGALAPQVNEELSLSLLLGRAGVAYAQMLRAFGIGEAATFHQGALNQLRHGAALAGADPLLDGLLHAAESLPLTLPPVELPPLHLHYHDPFIAWGGPANRRGYLAHLEQRCRREGVLLRYQSPDLTAGSLHAAGSLHSLYELPDLPIRQVWELTAPLGLNAGRPLRTLTFLERVEGSLEILVEPWLAALGAEHEIRLAWDAAIRFAA